MTATLALLSLLLTPRADAGGLFYPNQGVHGQAQGGAFVASADDFSALYWNPAALIHLEGWGLAAGLTLARQPVEFQRAGGEGRWKACADDEPNCLDPSSEDHAAMLARPYDPVSNEAPWRTIPQFGLHYRFKKPDLTLALGLTTPIAAWLDYPVVGVNDTTLSPARYRMISARLDQARIALGAAWRPDPHVTIGLTAEVVYLHLLQRFTASAHLFSDETGNDENPDYDVDVRFEATGFQPYGSIGLIVSPLPKVFDIALAFQPPLPAKVPGELRLYRSDLGSGLTSQIGDGSQQLNLDTTDDDLRLNLTLPMILRAGLAVQPHPRALIELATEVEFWDQTTEIAVSGVNAPLTDAAGTPLVDQIDALSPLACVLIDCAGLPDTYEGDDGKGNVVLPAGYQTTARVSLGGRAIAVEPTWTRPGLITRLGGFFETRGVPDDALTVGAPDNLRAGFGLGATLDYRGFGVSLAYSRAFVPERTLSGTAGTQIAALESTVPNPIDDGVYRKMNMDLLSVQLLFDFARMTSRGQ